MGQAALTVRRTIRVRYLQWRTERNRDIAVRHLDVIALALEGRGWRCVKTYRPEVVPVRFPLLRVYGKGSVVTTLSVLAVPGGRWGFHEAPRGRGGFLCHCGGDVAQEAKVIDGFLRNRLPR
ncbi:hypothetical protein [Actinomadura rubrisoli]|uniref:Uncharacterized protein n=1 Tax=Actinomadura rubrisoli TaxID=2530368 RepID=A0A4R5C8A4_9ACTN|nr:hypothetical protein [Actinomadura rubrisoli]TDD94353.1 hypothetical protein E1298_07085 [Actinomadura rubrisoli]